MSLFLFKPHVEGPEGNITTPDIVIDRLYIDGRLAPINALTSETYLQTVSAEKVNPAFVITALGGGALIGPAAVMSSGRVVVARCAWRLNNLDGNIHSVRLNGNELSALTLPADLIEAAGGSGDTLPRGYQLVCTAPGPASDVVLEDPTRRRVLNLKLALSPVDLDRWGDLRPKPRYSVGPVKKEVPHFI